MLDKFLKTHKNETNAKKLNYLYQKFISILSDSKSIAHEYTETDFIALHSKHVYFENKFKRLSENDRNLK